MTDKHLNENSLLSALGNHAVSISLNIFSWNNSIST